jgi:catechol 2,3-dioxygenase-like lactoylglutathione lyase family enzyme
MQITGINHVGFNAVGKHEETLEFYALFLGFKSIERTGAAKLVNGFWFGRKSPIIHIVTDPPIGVLEMPYGTHLSLFVNDIDAAVAEVKEMTDQHLHVGEGRDQTIWFRDPAGNTLEFQQDPLT